ncbi:MAG: dTDP-4-dehydrorhamnose 3,5-epimerase [Chitinophagales bacterium]|jgi:dTDP-4-dehydrorhamnose 3,5-epimerase|nr:dTDP-4-dehydrorhamnose 3,5-epimerase [Chitinophagales bacterium]
MINTATETFVQQTGIEGLVVINPRVFGDQRGYFYESYNQQQFEKHGLYYNFVQDNQAFSTYGVLRGLHFQTQPYSQTKLVRVVLGEVLDVVVDLRHQSKTYGQSYSIILSADNHKQLLVPQGFAHGYVVLSQEALFVYKCDNYYAPKHDSGILYNDPQLAIDWMIPESDMIVSEKDQIQPLFDPKKIIF